jgi:hypothetical protein
LGVPLAGGLEVARGLRDRREPEGRVDREQPALVVARDAVGDRR